VLVVVLLGGFTVNFLWCLYLNLKNKTTGDYLKPNTPLVANLVISNVPGPPVPLYMAGARMVANYPTSIVVHGLALNITVQSYDQQMDFGLMADAAAMPDVRLLADALRVAFDDLCLLDAETAAPPTLAETGREVVGQARRRLLGGLGQVGGAVGSAVSSMVGGVVKGAMSGAVQQAMAAVTSSGTPRRPKVSAKAAAPVEAEAVSRKKAKARLPAVRRR